MKIAITTTGKTLDAEVDPRFGRATAFAIYDVERDEFELADNAQNLNAAQGAGIQAAQNVASKEVSFLLTGHCGPKAFRTLSVAGIKVIIGVKGTIRQAIDDFKADKLTSASSADVEGHWV